MERTTRRDYNLLFLRSLLLFVLIAVLVWFFTYPFVNYFPTLRPFINTLQIKSLLEVLIYLVIFLIVMLPFMISLIAGRSEIRRSCENSLLYQTLLNKITSLNEPDLGKFLDACLEMIGEDLDLTRIYLYKYISSTQSLTVTSQWVPEDITPLSKLQTTEIFQYPIFNKWLTENIPVYIIDTKGISDLNTRSLFQNRRAHSLLVVPLVTHSGSRYLLCLETAALRKWPGSEINVMDSIAKVLVKSIDENDNKLRIEDLSYLKNRFVDIIGKELKGPLKAMQLNIDNLLSKKLGDLPELQEKVVKLLLESNEKISEKVSLMLMMLDFESGRIILNKEESSLFNITDQEYQQFVQLCQLKEQKPLFLHTENGNWNAFIDKEKIALAIRSILQNATDYSHKYGSIEVKLEVTDGNFIFSVQDQGIGIPVSEQDKIFTPFYRATNAIETKTEATGIGLYLAKNIIEAHGGKMGFSSELEKGSYFWFTLPRR